MTQERDAAAGSAAPTAQHGAATRERAADGPGPDTGPARPARPWRAAFFTLTAAAILAVTVWALLGSSLLVARSVRVTGAPEAQRAEVLRAAAIAPGTPLIRIDPAAVARRVERITQVQSAQVSRDWPDSVVIAVRERTPALAVASGGGFALIDRFGVVISHVARCPQGMTLLASAPGRLASLRGSPAMPRWRSCCARKRPSTT
jgi:cell division protein FtsQ